MKKYKPISLRKWKNEAQRIALHHNNFDPEFVTNKLIERGLTAEKAKAVVRSALKTPSTGQTIVNLTIGVLVLLLLFSVVLGFFVQAFWVVAIVVGIALSVAGIVWSTTQLRAENA